MNIVGLNYVFIGLLLCLLSLTSYAGRICQNCGAEYEENQQHICPYGNSFAHQGAYAGHTCQNCGAEYKENQQHICPYGNFFAHQGAYAGHSSSFPPPTGWGTYVNQPLHLPMMNQATSLPVTAYYPPQFHSFPPCRQPAPTYGVQPSGERESDQEWPNFADPVLQGFVNLAKAYSQAELLRRQLPAKAYSQAELLRRQLIDLANNQWSRYVDVVDFTSEHNIAIREGRRVAASIRRGCADQEGITSIARSQMVNELAIPSQLITIMIINGQTNTPFVVQMQGTVDEEFINLIMGDGTSHMAGITLEVHVDWLSSVLDHLALFGDLYIYSSAYNPPDSDLETDSEDEEPSADN